MIDVLATATVPGLRLRILGREDLPLIAEFGQAFWKEAGQPGTFDAPRFVRWWQTIYEQDLGRILVGDEAGLLIGGCGWIQAPSPYTGDLESHLNFWYVVPARRGSPVGLRLLRRWRDLMIEAKVQILRVGHFGGPHEKVGRFYQALGFELDPSHSSYRQIL